MQANPETMDRVVLAIVLVLVIILALIFWARWKGKILHVSEKANKKLEDQLAIVDAMSRDYLNVYAVNTGENTAKI